MGAKTELAVYWFRKCLRLHDNPALIKCINAAENTEASVAPIFILDPWFVKNAKVGKNRWKFLQQSLTDLDNSLNKLGSRLYVLRGTPTEVFDSLISKHNVRCIAYERDTEPYARNRDSAVVKLAQEHSIKVISEVSHTLYDPDRSIALNGGSAPKTYQSFHKLMDKLGTPAQALQAPDTIGRLPDSSFWSEQSTHVPTDEELFISGGMNIKFPGGETEALSRMSASLSNKDWVCKFEKPSTSPNSLKPSTTVLSPYLKFGCLSPRLFYHNLSEVYQGRKHSAPPGSLHGQLIWREFFYTVAYNTPNFDRMLGNPLCKQIPWSNDEAKLLAWKQGRTGYPFIDAIMRQLATEGWIHHLARHAVACFLTRGDLWISWEKGMQVFEEYLLDADWSLNAANWMWLSASAFFHQYYRVYSPVAFGKKTDKTGAYIRRYIPELENYPTEYIFEPWKAPPGVQKMCKCVIGTDYPRPIVDHETARKTNLERMNKAYKSQSTSTAAAANKKQASTAGSANKKQSKPTTNKHKLTENVSKAKDSPAQKKQKLK